MDIIIDSGAYTAWRLGKPVVLEEYCEFLRANAQYAAHYVALDEINPEDPEAAARVSFDNYLKMRRMGFDPMPVFHMRESMDWLHRLIDAGAKHIGLAAHVIINKGESQDWYNLVMAHCVDGDGRPLVRLHALGEGREEVLRRFPWFSADSTSWIYSAQRNGMVVLDKRTPLSMRNDGRNQRRIPDIDSLDSRDEGRLMELLASYRLKPEALAVLKGRDRPSTIVRTYIAACEYMKMVERVDSDRTKLYRPEGLFGGGAAGRGIDLGDLHFYFVIGGNYIAASALAVAGAKRALMSYAYVATVKHYRDIGEYAMDPHAYCAKDKRTVESYNLLRSLTYEK